MKTKKEWEERAQEILREEWSRGTNQEAIAAMLQLGREMAAEAADARAEVIAQAFESTRETVSIWRCEAAVIARSTITKPKTREAVLEEALRAIAHGGPPGSAFQEREDFSQERARRLELMASRALDWRP